MAPLRLLGLGLVLSLACSSPPTTTQARIDALGPGADTGKTADSGTSSAPDDGGSADAGGMREDAGAPDGGNPAADAGAPDAGAPDAGTGDAGTPDAGAADACAGPTTLPEFPLPSVPVQTCGVIGTSGSYVLSADLTGTDGPCLTLASAHAVKLDCAGHTVTALQPLSVSNVEGFEITGCVFQSPSALGSLTLSDAGTGAFHDNTVKNVIVNLERGEDIHAYANHFSGAWQQRTTHGSSVSCNVMASPFLSPITAALIISSVGSQNRFEKNDIDGLWNGVRGPSPVGADDGIVLADENHSWVQGNTITRVWDCGIESTGYIHDVTLDGNDITQAGNCGIGGWYWSSVSNSLFSNNKVEGSVYAFMFMRNFGLRPEGDGYPADDDVRFDHNVFDTNSLEQDEPGNPVVYMPVFSNMGYVGDLSGVSGERVPQANQFIITNNVFRNNDFEPDSQHAYFGSPVVPGVVVDEGGNLCPVDPSGPLTCGP